MIWKFQSAPTHDGGIPAAESIRTHEVSLSPSELYLFPLWSSFCVFLGSTIFVWLGLRVGRWKGFNVIRIEDAQILPILFGLVFGAFAFVTAVEVELRYRMQMQVLKDRKLGWGEFNILHRKRIRRNSEGSASAQSPKVA